MKNLKLNKLGTSVFSALLISTSCLNLNVYNQNNNLHASAHTEADESSMFTLTFDLDGGTCDGQDHIDPIQVPVTEWMHQAELGDCSKIKCDDEGFETIDGFRFFGFIDNQKIFLNLPSVEREDYEYNCWHIQQTSKNSARCKPVWKCTRKFKITLIDWDGTRRTRSVHPQKSKKTNRFSVYIDNLPRPIFEDFEWYTKDGQKFNGGMTIYEDTEFVARHPGRSLLFGDYQGDFHNIHK